MKIRITKENLGCPEERARADWRKASELTPEEARERWLGRSEPVAYNPIAELVRELAYHVSDVLSTLEELAEVIENGEH